jgi:hypothetical protein
MASGEPVTVPPMTKRLTPQPDDGEAAPKRSFWDWVWLSLQHANAVTNSIASLAVIGTVAYLASHVVDKVRWKDREYLKLEAMPSW